MKRGGENKEMCQKQDSLLLRPEMTEQAASRISDTSLWLLG